MNGIRHEERHHTDEQVRDVLDKAVTLVDDLGIPAELREAAFVKACDLYAAKNIVIEQVQPHPLGLDLGRG